MRHSPSIDELRFVFVVTYGRSGSTLLNNILNAIPGYQIRGENYGALFRLHQAAAAVRRTHDGHGDSDLRLGVESPFYGAARLAPAVWEEALAAMFVSDVLRPAAATRVSGFKEIRHTPDFMTDAEFRAYLDFLLAAFPDSRVVFNLRDIEQVIRSDWWDHRERDEVRRMIARADARFRAYHEAVPARTLLMHYNDYAGRPEQVAGLFDFLGERFDAEAVRDVMRRPVSKPRSGLRERLVDLA